VVADGLVVDRQQLGDLSVGEAFEISHFEDLAATAGQLFNFLVDGFQHQRFYIIRQLAVLRLLEEGVEEILLPEMATLDMPEEIQTCVTARDEKKCLYILDTAQIGAHAPQLDKDVGRDILGVFTLRNKPFYKVVKRGKVLIVYIRERLGVTLVELDNKIVFGALHQIEFR